MSRHVGMRRATCTWAIVLGLVVLVMAGPASAQPVDIPATWGGDLGSRPRLTGNWGGLRDALGKKGVVFDVDLLLTPQWVTTGGRDTTGVTAKLSVGGGDGVCHSSPVAPHGFGPASGL
jgi:hypothetical protein